MRKTGLRSRILAMLLCFLMVFTSIPTDAFAAETTINKTQETKEASVPEITEESKESEFDDLQIEEIIEEPESDQEFSIPTDEKEFDLEIEGIPEVISDEESEAPEVGTQTFGIMVNNSYMADKQNPVKAVLGEDGIYRVENYTTTVNYLWLSLPEDTTVKEYTLYQGSTSSSPSKYLNPRSNNNVYEGTTYQYYINTNYTLPLVAKFDLEKDNTTSSHYVIVDSKSAGSYVVSADGFTAEPSSFYGENGITFAEADQTVTLTPTTTSIGSGDAQNIKWTWSTSDPKVALVDSTGKVTSIGGGTATITAKYHQISVSCTVTSTAEKHTTHTYVSNKCSVCGTKKPSNVNVKFTLVDQTGEFAKAKDNTELYKTTLSVSDADCDGTVTYNDLFLAAHTSFYSDGTNGFATADSQWGPYITKFWGVETGSIGYLCNHKTVDEGLKQKLSSNGNVVAFFYRDTTNWSDTYTYFTKDSTKLVTGTEKSFEINYTATQVPEGATVTVYDSKGSTVQTTSVKADGTFGITLSEAGSYSILVHGTTSADAPVVPSRMTLEAFAPVSAKLYMTVVNDEGNFVKTKTGQEVYRFPFVVKDDPENPDGRVTIYEALQQIHAQECPAGAAGFTDENGFIKYLWGENTGGYLGYYFNDVYMNGNQQLKTGTNGREFKDQLLGTEIVDGKDYYTIYAYQSYTDSYTYFNPVEETAVAGVEKTFTVYGNSTYGNAASPAGALIKISDSTGAELTELGTTVGSDGTFKVTFPKAGKYTIDLRTNGNKCFTPSRCFVTVTAAEATTQAHFLSAFAAAPGSTLENIELKENAWSYELAVPSSKTSTYIKTKLTLSEAAPEGATITASYKKSSGEDASVTLTSGKTKSISTPINTGMTGSSITFTVGVEGNTQTYILNVVRTVDLKINAITDGDGSTFPLYEGQYLVPEATEKIKLTADSYGSDLTINGADAVSGEAFEVTPTWGEDGIFKVTVKSAHEEEAKEETLVFKKYKETDELSGTCGENAAWKLANGVLTISGSGDMQDFASNQGMPWYSLMSMIKEVTFDNAITSVGNYSFYGATALTKVTLPTAVKGIGQEAFSGCTSLESISLPEGLQTLKLKAFYNTGLTEVSIPATVSSVGQYVFCQCKALKSAEITNAMGEYMFQECSLLSQVTFSGTTLKVIPRNAFANCTTLKTLTIPEGVTEYITWTEGYGVAFYFENVTIPNTLTGIQADTFGDKLTAINVKEDNPNYVKIGKILYTKDKKSLILAEKDLTGEVTVADGAESINDYAFYKVTGITKVVLPDTVKTIGKYSFDHCSGLKTVVLGKGLESIGEAGFGYCTVLTDITLPSSLTTLGQKAFWFCKALKTIEIPEKVTALPNLLFSNATALESVIFPAGLTAMEERTFFSNTALKTIYFRGSSAAWNTVKNRPADGTYEIVYNYGRTDIASITVQPEDRFFVIGADATDGLSITVTKPENVSVSFTWYVNDQKSSIGGTALTTGTRTSEDGLTSYCTPDISAAGTKYYYCVVTSTLTAETVESNSRIASVEVAEKLWEGEGTASEPFKLSSAEDVKKLSDYVSNGSSTEGKYFVITKDITLPADWSPIGTDKQRFAGTIDGKLDEAGTCATITVPEGGKPLFDYVINATIKNLNIKGTKIDGYGLIDHFNGISITSKTTIENIRILSGTQILKSGLLGSEITTNIYAGSSASYTAEIRNCTVESDVVIGYTGEYSKIGSLAGRFIGTMENCESSATVKGVDYVGGLVGNADNATGTCVVKNSSFHGTVDASGQFAGGIIGGGYEDGALASAPNGSRPSIQGCTVDGTVKGNESVGGITGGDRLVAQSWGSQYVTGNNFSGTISGKKYVGGIIGYYRSLNKYDNISANTYSNAETGIGYVAILDTNVENPGKFDDTLILNTGKGTADCPTVQYCNWKANHNRTDDPLGKNAEDLCKKVSGETPAEPTCYEIKATGTYKTEYTVGEELDLTGIVITAYWTNNKAATTLNLSDIEITGFDKNTVGKQTITLSYGSVKTEILVNVKNKEGMISVTLSIMGDQAHDSDSDGKVHTLTGGNLTTWVAAKAYTISSNTTAWELIKSVLDENKMTYSNPTGNYIEWITKDGVKLDQKANGVNSGWMFTVNGVHGLLGVSEQYMKTGDVLVLHYTDDYTQEKDDVAAMTAEEVIALIDQVPKTITLDCKEKIEAARAAYTKLEASERSKVTNYQTLLDAEKALNALQQNTANIKNVYQTTGNYLSSLGTPNVSSIGGEWMVLGLARSGRTVPAGYFDNVVSYVKKNIDSNGRLHTAKSTDNSRVILALTAAGYDPRNVGGYNLVTALSDMDYVEKQGINGPIWALIALNSHSYATLSMSTGNPTTRTGLVKKILSAQLADGGWAMSGNTADSDMTGMALQALAPYYDSNATVKAAVDKALTKLSSMQEDNGAFATVGTITSESTAQVIVALSALGIDADTDSRFIKNGFSAVDALLSFAVDGGGFKHIVDGNRDGMATEQGYYALTAYMRMKDGKTSLYDMSDVMLKIGTVTDQNNNNNNNNNNNKDNTNKNDGNDNVDQDQTLSEAYQKLHQYYLQQMANQQKMYANLLKNSKNSKTASTKKTTTATKKTASAKLLETDLTVTAEEVREKINKITGTSLAGELLDVILSYEMLTEEDQEALGMTYTMESMKKQLAAQIQTDDASGIVLSGADWNIELVVADILDLQEVQSLSEKLNGYDALCLWDISLKDLLTGETYTPGESVLIKIPLESIGDYSSYDGLVVVHYTKDGGTEFLNCTIVGNYLVFNTVEFSDYAVVGYHGASPVENLMNPTFAEAESAENRFAWVPWTICCGCGLAVLGALYVTAMKNKKKVQAGE